MENGPNKDNTIVVLWSDHGWHLGEKQYWQKIQGLASPRVRAFDDVRPGGHGRAAAGNHLQRPGESTDSVSNLNGTFRLAADGKNDGSSLVPLLKNPDAAWPHVSITYQGRPGNFGLSGRPPTTTVTKSCTTSTTTVTNGTISCRRPQFASKIDELKSYVPKKFAEYAGASVASLPKLKWTPLGEETAPASEPDGDKFNVVFSNKAGRPIRVFWINSQGELRPNGKLETGWSKPYQTRPGAVWMITGADEKPLGDFTIVDRTAHAVIPSSNR